MKEGEHLDYLGVRGKGKRKPKQHAVVPPVIASDSDSDCDFVAKKNVGQSKKFDTLSIEKRLENTESHLTSHSDLQSCKTQLEEEI